MNTVLNVLTSSHNLAINGYFSHMKHKTYCGFSHKISECLTFSLTPVSYTHLDVYKRQTYDPSSD